MSFIKKRAVLILHFIYGMTFIKTVDVNVVSLPDFLFYDSDNILSTLSFLAPSLKSKHTKRGIEEDTVKNESDVRRKGEKEEAEGPKEQESGEEGQQEVSGEDQDASEGSDEGAERLEEAGESSGNSGQQKQPSLVAINGKEIQGGIHCIHPYTGELSW
jgi:hypothetical protein